MIVIGTSGYSFRDWRGVFYPEEMKPADYLEFYAQQFSAVEINTTYYGIPKPAVFEGMLQRTPDHFGYMVKVNKATTHESNDSAVSGTLLDSVRPLREAERLSGLLAQFPWKFRNTGENRAYLAGLRNTYGDIPLFAEFRHDSWAESTVHAFLRDIGIGYVSVDEPQMGNMMPPDAVATGETAYIRFHGRNTDTWWGEGDRYDYDYAEGELEPWADRVEALEKSVRKTYAFFNNCHQGHAVRNALQFRDMLARRGLNLDLPTA